MEILLLAIPLGFIVFVVGGILFQIVKEILKGIVGAANTAIATIFGE